MRSPAAAAQEKAADEMGPDTAQANAQRKNRACFPAGQVAAERREDMQDMREMVLMALKNYSTKINVNQTVLEIEQILAKHNVTDIWKQYGTGGDIEALNFAVNTEFGKVPFRLPVDVEAVRQIIIGEKRKDKVNLSRREAESYQHARQVAWRIIKDWIDSQMALVDISMVKLEQVFLPYIYNFETNKSLYEAMREKRFAGLLMAPVEEKENG